jgi:hypothetical protein
VTETTRHFSTAEVYVVMRALACGIVAHEFRPHERLDVTIVGRMKDLLIKLTSDEGAASDLIDEARRDLLPRRH